MRLLVRAWHPSFYNLLYPCSPVGLVSLRNYFTNGIRLVSLEEFLGQRSQRLKIAYSFPFQRHTGKQVPGPTISMSGYPRVFACKTL